MKSTLLFIALLIAIGVSVFFAYERSFVTKDFEVVNSEEEEEGGGEEEVSENMSDGESVPEEEFITEAEEESTE